MNKDKLTDLLTNSKNNTQNQNEQKTYIAIVDSLTPLKTKFYADDTAINVSTLNVFGLKIGAKVLMIKNLSKFIIIGVIGNVTQSYCILQRTTTQSIPTTTHEYLDFSSGTVVNDPLGMFDGTNKITIPEDGLYNINVAYRWEDDDTTTVRITEIILNNDNRISTHAGSPDVTGRFGVNLSLNLKLSKDDYIRATAYHTTGSNINIGPHTSSYGNIYFSVVPITTGSAIQTITSSVDSTKKVKVKQSSQGSTTSSSFTTDNELEVALDPNKSYKVHFNLVVNNSSGTPDMLINFVPSGTVTLYGSVHFRCMSVDGTNAAAYEEGKTSCYTSIGSDIYIGLASGYGSARGTMLLKGGATGGTIGLKFRQRYTDGSNASYIRSGSFIEYYEVEEV